MILMRLLSAGKTLVGVGQNEKSYRLPEEGALPRFNEKKNPFRATTLPERARSAQTGESAVHAKVDPAPGQTDAPPRKVREQGNEAVRTKIERATGQMIRGVRGVLGRMRLAGSNKLASTGHGPVSTTEKNTRPAQGELRLECVRVVRNDLSESDVEIVPRESALKEFVNRVPGAAAAAQAKAASETAWSRVSARIFGPNNVC